MHSLLCCGIFRVPSQKEKLYKIFVEILSSMPSMYKVTSDMAAQKNTKFIQNKMSKEIFRM